MTFPKRGAFAKDTRTGQVVRVAEEGRGADWLVRTARKSDGYWVSQLYLEPARNPHIWTGKQLAGALLIWAVAVLVSLASWNDLTDHGLSPWDAFVYTLPVGTVVLTALNYLSGLYRS